MIIFLFRMFFIYHIMLGRVPPSLIFAEAMKYKRYKTLIPQYFDSESNLNEIEHIYYMDIDM